MDDYDPNSMPVDKARLFIKQFLTPVAQTEVVTMHQSLGRIIAQDILSPANVPNYDNSAMDGYAFNAQNLDGTQLKVIGTAFAGKAFNGKVSAGECVRIMTGAAMPQGTDTVAVQEKVLRDGDTITLNEIPKPQANVRYAGEDLKQGQCLLSAGHLIRPADLGLLSSLGIDNIKVYRKLQVAFFFSFY